MSDEIKKELKEESSEKKTDRREFLSTTAAAAAGVAVGASLGGAKEAEAVTRGFLPLSTPISDMLRSESASLLTSAASALTKGDLLSLRQFHARETPHADPPTSGLSLEDLRSVETAFDDHNQKNSGIKSRSLSVDGDGTRGLTHACCCCTPCCTCAAAVTKPSKLV